MIVKQPASYNDCQFTFYVYFLHNYELEYFCTSFLFCGVYSQMFLVFHHFFVLLFLSRGAETSSYQVCMVHNHSPAASLPPRHDHGVARHEQLGWCGLNISTNSLNLNFKS